MMAPGALAAVHTEIIDPFPRGDDTYVDTSVTLSWEMLMRQGRILREFRCLKHDTIEAGGTSLCRGGSKIMLARELVARRETHLMHIDAALSFRRYFMANLRIPIVLYELTQLEYDAGVTSSNSSVDPYNIPSLFSVPNSGPIRSGVKDPTLSLRFAPWSFVRDPTQATWILELAVTTGLVGVKQASNSKVGDGTWVLGLGTAISARPEWWVEPWFRMGTAFRFQGMGSLFGEYSTQTQRLTSPGHEISASFGTTFIPYESVKRQSTFTIDVGTRIHYRFQGREYTDLFDALGSSSCDPSDSAEPCDLTTYDRDKKSVEEVSQRRRTDGITDVQQHATVSGWLGVRYQILEWVSLKTGFSMAYEFPHFITFADPGIDLDGNEVVTSEGDLNEYNPVYAEALDGLGNHFRTGGTMTYGVTAGLQGKF
jgi:hypothetical protein